MFQRLKGGVQNLLQPETETKKAFDEGSLRPAAGATGAEEEAGAVWRR